MKAFIAALSVATVASAAPDNCMVANEFAAAIGGNCDIVKACYELAANHGFANDAWVANEGFNDSNDAFANAGFADFANMGWANEPMMNEGAFSNQGFLANQGAMSNQGFDANQGAVSNDAFVGNDGFDFNMGYDSNFGFANSGFFADMCLSLLECGAFDHSGALGGCSGAATGTAMPGSTATPTPLVCEEVFIGDGVCDEACDSAEFGWDGGDCPTPTTTQTGAATETESA